MYGLRLLLLSAALALVWTPTGADAQLRPATRDEGRTPIARGRPRAPSRPAAGTVRCVIEENGSAARGRATIEQNGRSVASIGCPGVASVPAGSYVLVALLDGATDRASQRVSVRVSSGTEATATARFSTGLLEVRITQNGQASNGRASIRSGGREVGSLGSGVVGRLAPGTYEVVVTHGSEMRTMSVTLSAGQRRTLQARF